MVYSLIKKGFFKLQLNIKQIGVNKVVSKINNNDTPSIPKIKWLLEKFNHSNLSINWNLVIIGSNINKK